MSKNTTIQHKRSSVSGNVPDNAQIEVGELAINFPDKTLYTKDGEGQIVALSEPNPFDQNLNTTDQVEFAKLTVGPDSADDSKMHFETSVQTHDLEAKETSVDMDTWVYSTQAIAPVPGSYPYHQGAITLYGGGKFISFSNFSQQSTWQSYSDDGGYNWKSAGSIPEPFTYVQGGVYAETIEKWVTVGSYAGISNGDEDLIMHSDDGINWTLSAGTGGNIGWQDVATNGSRFVAVADVGAQNVRIQYSDDGGVTWTVASASSSPEWDDGQWTSVGYDPTNDRWVALSRTDYTMYSDDGINWVPGGRTPVVSISVHTGNSIVTDSFARRSGFPFLQVSAEGRWIATSLPDISTYNGRGDAASSTYLDKMIYSDDGGLTWLDASTGIAGELAYAHGRFLCMAGYYSDDGLNWTPYDNPHKDTDFNDGHGYSPHKIIAYGEGRFLQTRSLTYLDDATLINGDNCVASLSFTGDRSGLFYDGALLATEHNLQPLFDKVNSLLETAPPVWSLLDPNNATSSEFTGGSGTESDPFEVSPVSTNLGDVEVHVATVNITGLDAGQVVYVEDLQAETNGDRFTAGARVADESGVLTVNIGLNDNPHSASASVYQGKLRIGGTIYINANVAVYNALEGGTVFASPTNTQPAGPVEWKGSGGRMLTATYPLVISVDGYYFTDQIETTDNDTEIWTKWAGDPGSGDGIDGPHGTTITGAVTDDVGGAQFFQLTILKETSFVLRNFVDSDQAVGGVSESRVVTAHTVNSYVYPSGTTTGSSPEYAKNGGSFTTMPATNTGSATDYLIDGDELQLRHQDAATNNTASTYTLDTAGDTADWTTVTAAAVPTILQPKIASPATDGELNISKSGPFVSSDFEMAEGTDTHTASSWEMIVSSGWTKQTGLKSVTDTRPIFAVTWSPELSLFCAAGGGSGGKCATSPDGVNWTKQTGFESAADEHNNYGETFAIIWSPELSLFCAIGPGGRCLTSPDGVNWTHQPSFVAAVEDDGRQRLVGAIAWDGTQFCVVGEYGKCVTSPDGVTWTNQPGLTSIVEHERTQFMGITWSPELSLFCAVGEYDDWSGGNCVTSPDGVTWTRQPSLTSVVGDQGGSFTCMYSVVWDGSQFCAVGTYGACATSPDGVTWTAQPSLAAAVDNGLVGTIVWTGTQFCAVTTSHCATSPDGVTWTRGRGFGLAIGFPYPDQATITWSPELNLLCAVGKNGACATFRETMISLDSDTSALTSWEPDGLEDDISYTVRVKHHTATLNSEWSEGRSFRTEADLTGVVWTAQPSLASAVNSKNMESVTWDGTQFCAVGDSGKCATSPDGVTWTNQPGLESAVSTYRMYSVVWNGNQFVAVGAQGRCATSPDGVTWTEQPGIRSAISTYYMYSVAWDGSQYCAVGMSGRCATSPDGVTWTEQPSLPTAVDNSSMKSVTWDGTQFCAVGEQGKCATSPDGVTWTLQPSFTTAVGSDTVMRSVAWDGSQFCAVGDNGICATSPDGVTWTRQLRLALAVNANKMNTVVWNGSQFFAAGEHAEGATSPDGVTWRYQQSFHSAVISSWQSEVTWSGTQFCSVGSGAKCATS